MPTERLDNKILETLVELDAGPRVCRSACASMRSSAGPARRPLRRRIGHTDGVTGVLLTQAGLAIIAVCAIGGVLPVPPGWHRRARPDGRCRDAG